MAVLVFSTRNSTITDSAWHVGKAGGLQAVSRGSRSIGICCAMTAVWIRKSLAGGAAGVTTREELGSQHSIAIVAGAYFAKSMPGRQPGGVEPPQIAGMRALLASQGLDLAQHQHGFNSAAFEIATILASVDGYAFFGLFGPSGGHAMGVRIDANHYEFFDPNFGLSRYRSKVEFRTGVQDMIEYYEDQLGAPMRWDIGRV